MPIDDLTALGQKMREARKNKELTQQELSDLSHVSVKQIANIEKGKMNPSYLILRALAKVLHISLDTLINPDISLEDEGVNQMKMLYSSCPPEMRDTLLHHTHETVRELTELCTCCAVYSIVNDRLLYDGFFSFAVVRQLVPFALILTSNPHRNVTDTRCFDRIMG